MNRINSNGEVPQIEFKAPEGFKLPIPENNNQQAYMAMLAVHEAEKKRIKRNQFKHDLFIAIVSATASAILTNIDRIIGCVMELIPLLANFLLRQ